MQIVNTFAPTGRNHSAVIRTQGDASLALGFGIVGLAGRAKRKAKAPRKTKSEKRKAKAPNAKRTGEKRKRKSEQAGTINDVGRRQRIVVKSSV